MKKELEIAKENIENRNKCLKADCNYFVYLNRCQEHKATCQRWLENLKEVLGYVKCLENKKEDLKQTIALYEENGI